MSRRVIAYILLVIGALMAAFAMFGPQLFGLNNFPQWAVFVLGIVGILLVVIAALLLVDWGKAPAKAEAGAGAEAETVEAKVEAKPEASPEAAPAIEAKPAVDDEPDDLTKIEGIGPKLQSILYLAGVKTFASLANHDADEIETLVKNGGFKAPFDPASWPEQARLAAAGDWDKLKELQENLTAGRDA